ncbi:lipoprotein insertase outer membrane protein LolB [Methylotetracoccus oryzae]|uniref:lipoprotein insertase outer membrane protein LolB n=1 Tax=Methylotetracoccus oryzae TaxID=1919059 RepID=UPI00111BBFD5|nr:lipoprotein insertase outer membrane protein LolB [Methylotetracoccus oryzae]
MSVRTGVYCALISLLLGLAASGCAPRLPPVAATPDAQSRLLGLTHWRMVGRIGAQTASEGFHGSIRWEHENAQDRVQVSGPLSQGGVSIVLQDDWILIRDDRGEVKTSRDAAALVRQELGFPVPLSSLRYWVIGVPRPARDAVPRYDAAGLLRELKQEGWSLAYEQFVSAQGVALPRKLSASGDEMKLKLVVDEWEILP